MNDDKLKELATEEDKIEGIGPLAISPELLATTKKKRPYNRKSKTVITPVEKVESVEREWHCSTCREDIPDREVMKLAAGDHGRFAVFCNNCQKSLGFLQPDVDKMVNDFIKGNPTGK